MSLEELLERYFASDDEQAMAELVQKTRPKLIAAARRICGADAEDAVQTAYLSLAKRGGLGGSPVLPWLLTAVARIAYRTKATHAKEHAIAERLAPSAAPPEPPEIAVGKEEALLLQRELWKLPPDYRDALQLRYLHGLSGAETARLLGVNDSTLRTRLQRGRMLLRSRLARVLQPFLALPWLFKDAKASAALVLGGTMKLKLALVAVLLAALGVLYVSSRGRAPAARTRADAVIARGANGSLRVATDEEQSAGARDAGGAVEATGIVVDEAGAPIPDVRAVWRGTYEDKRLGDEIRAAYRQRGLDPPADAYLRPDWIDDKLRAKPPAALTDAEGRFRVGDEPAGRYSLLFLKDGYGIHEERTLGPAMRVVLSPARPLEGRVTELSGLPIAGARVETEGDNPGRQSTQTDAEGRFAFLSLPRETPAVWASAIGYSLESRQDPPPVVDLRLKRSILIVDVTDAETGRPLANACARLATGDGQPFERLFSGGWPGRSTVAGRCLVGPYLSKFLEGKKSAEAVVHVFAPGYEPVLEPIVFRPGEEPPHLAIALRPGDGPPALAGTVTGAPVAHIVVRNALYLQTEDYEYVTEADTAPGGRFLFSGLPRSDYLLVVTAPGMGKVTRRVAVKTEDIEIDLSPAAVLEVLARDRRGAPVAGTVIHVEQPDGKRHWTARTDGRGWAVFDDLPAQELEVVAVVEGWNRPIHDREVPTTEVTPAAGARTQLTVTVPEPLPVTILVRDEAGRPHEGVLLGFEHRFKGVVSVVGKAEHERLQSLRATTDLQGRAEASLYQGEYGVMLQDGPTPVRVAVLTVGEDAGNRAECIVPRRTTGVHGRLREYGSNRALREAVLYVSDARDTWAIATARTDQEGRFEVRGLPNGLYTILSLTARADFAPCSAEIDLVQRDEIVLDLFAVPAALLSGALPCEVAVSVRSRVAVPLKDARITVQAKLGDGWAVMGDGATGADGRVVVPVLEAERYRIWASAEGHEGAETTVDRKGRSTDVQIDLAPKP